jgi:hypothetical protein
MLSQNVQRKLLQVERRLDYVLFVTSSWLMLANKHAHPGLEEAMLLASLLGVRRH